MLLVCVESSLLCKLKQPYTGLQCTFAGFGSISHVQSMTYSIPRLLLVYKNELCYSPSPEMRRSCYQDILRVPNVSVLKGNLIRGCPTLVGMYLLASLARCGYLS